MKKIVLLCAAGMSTSLLVEKMRDAAKNIGYECEINAYAISEIDTVKDGADIILLGPQVRFSLKKIAAQCPEIPVEAINPTDYGMMNGTNILEHVKTVIG